MTISRSFHLCLLSLFCLTTLVQANEGGGHRAPGNWPIDRLKSEVPAYRIEDPDVKIQSLIYEGETVDGQATEVFAFYASPRTLGVGQEGETYPGVVLIHGGGGTAFADWVWMWANRGYAAIAMDLGGRRPPSPTFDQSGNLEPYAGHKRKTRIKLAHGGPSDGHPEKFDCIGGRVDDDWPYHATASVMRAHTLIRSFPEVDADRTAVTGISWGGYTTCLAASLDDRFKAAVPVYGCGFLHEGESVQKPSIDRLGDRRDAWVAAYDPGSHLSKCTVPTLWVNGTHDIHYVLDSYAKSYAKVAGPRTMRIEPRMPHGHQAGWNPPEIQIFMDSILKQTTPLPSVEPMQVSDRGTVTVPFQSDTKIVQSALHFTTQTGLRSKREWQSIDCVIFDNQVKAKGLPPEANTWLVTMTDDRGALVSTEVGFR